MQERIIKMINVIIVINIILFFISFLNNDFFYNYILYPLNSEKYKWYQTLTCSFLHVNIIHLTFNFFVFDSCRITEKTFSAITFCIIYVLSAIISSIVYLNFNHDNMPMTGASGAILGIVGVETYLMANAKIRFLLFPFVYAKMKYMIPAAILIFDVILPLLVKTSIAHESHIGGFLFGFFVSYLLDKFKIIDKQVKTIDEQVKFN